MFVIKLAGIADVVLSFAVVNNSTMESPIVFRDFI